ncbi:B-cell receptor CD22-like [Lethenteron reissneri]|uniref:B-cell receptor CD22-like n=1 Tax=Lethenteron reissneri TaxID=7753 RepID=UPI002AB6E8B4|nr:B-cell receptor CD22-like [Lethenteron reissneri]
MPSIDVHPNRIVEGGNVTLSCRVPDGSSGSGDDVTVSWFRDGCPLGEDTRGNRSLAMNSVDNGAVGHYGCVVSNACGRSPSAEVRVDVHYANNKLPLEGNEWTTYHRTCTILAVIISVAIISAAAAVAVVVARARRIGNFGT